LSFVYKGREKIKGINDEIRSFRRENLKGDKTFQEKNLGEDLTLEGLRVGESRAKEGVGC